MDRPEETFHIRLEAALHALAVGLSLALRLAAISAAPLADAEAGWALQALAVARGEQVVLGAQPGLVMPTAILFFLFGGRTALARLLPALAGALLAGLPWFFRRRLGTAPSLLLAFSLALDPGLVALSRQADGAMLAVFFGLAALAAWALGRPLWTGAFIGLALLAGPAALSGLLAGVLAWVVWTALTGNARAAVRADHTIRLGTPAEGWRLSLLSGGGVVLLASTLFFRVPAGLGGLAEVIPAYLRGWTSASGVPATRLLADLLVYHPLPALFGLAAALRAWRVNDLAGRLLSIWFATALLLALLYPGRQVPDLAWALIPLWALAGRELAHDLAWDPVDGWTSAGQAAVILVFLSYIWLNLTSLARGLGDAQARQLRWELIAGAVALVVVSTFLIGLGWNRAVARRGLVWGLGLTLGLFTLVATFHAVMPPGGRAQEWWYPQPSTIEEDLLLQTIGDIAEWNTGRREGLEIMVTYDAPSLRWSLRDFPAARFASRLAADEQPPLVITAQEDEPRLAASYRGTDFLWRLSPGSEGALPPEALRWMIYRKAPTRSDQLILWARDDLFLEPTLEAPQQGMGLRVGW